MSDALEGYPKCMLTKRYLMQGRYSNDEQERIANVIEMNKCYWLGTSGNLTGCTAEPACYVDELPFCTADEKGQASTQSVKRCLYLYLYERNTTEGKKAKEALDAFDYGQEAVSAMKTIESCTAINNQTGCVAQDLKGAAGLVYSSSGANAGFLSILAVIASFAIVFAT